MKISILKLFSLFFLLNASPLLFSKTCVAGETQVTFYPTYGYQVGADWIIPMRAWVHEPRTLVEIWVVKIASTLEKLNPKQIANFRDRIQAFVADSESFEKVTFVFDQDPDNQEYQIQNLKGIFPRSNFNGLIEGFIKIPIVKATKLLKGQASPHAWLSYRTKSNKPTGQGRVQLIEPQGVSVISDIDDTIKVTQIPLGWKVVVQNTFFHDFIAVAEMASLYQNFRGASFHYVSGGPWQLYGPLSEFLWSKNVGFPEGTFHMKNVQKNLLNANTWEDLKDLVTNENATYDQKVAQISLILQHFPQRKFILVGDSGEKDPEVYRAIQQKFPHQVQEIKIRDILHDQEKNPARLDGMTIIAVPTR